MKKLLVLALIGLTCDLAAMEPTATSGVGSSRALVQKATTSSNPPATPTALAGYDRTDAEELQFLTDHCSTGTLTLEMYENRKKGNQYAHIYEDFVEANRATIDAVLAQTEYTTFKQLENAYTGLLFLRYTHNLDGRVLDQFTRDHIYVTNNEISAERAVQNGIVSSTDLVVNDVTKVEQAYKGAKMLYGLHLNQAHDSMKMRIEWWKEQLEALKKQQNNLGEDNRKTGSNVRTGWGSFLTSPRTLIPAGLLLLAGYYAYTRNSEDNKK